MARWRHIPATIIQLEKGEITPLQAVDAPLPSSVLHHFVLDCALRILQAESALGREPHPMSWQAIRIKRSWIEGTQSHASLVQIGEENRHLLASPLLESEEGMQALGFRLSAAIVDAALVSDPKVGLARLLRLFGAFMAGAARETIAWEIAVDQQLLWEQRHLARLLADFLSVYQQLLTLLDRRMRMIRSTIDTFQAELEDVLY